MEDVEMVPDSCQEEDISDMLEDLEDASPSGQGQQQDDPSQKSVVSQGHSNLTSPDKIDLATAIGSGAVLKSCYSDSKLERC